MAHFYASIRGNRSEATRTGSKDSGISGHVRGWDIGARVSCMTDGNGRDIVSVTITRGSNGCGHDRFVGNFYIDPGTGEIARVGEE